MSRSALARALLVLMAGTVLAVPVTAKEVTETLAELSLEELLEVDVVYGASKFEQSTHEAPASITVLRASDLKRYGYHTLADVLRAVRGFYVTNDTNYEYAGARGFARPGDYNTRILVLVDGHRVNDSIYDSAPIGMEMPVDTEMIDRIEIIRGPGSSLYGTSAMFGVVNVVTRAADELGRGSVSVEGGNSDAGRGQVRFGRRFESGVSLGAVATVHRVGGEDYYFAEFDDPATNHGRAVGVDEDDALRIFGKVTWKDLALNIVHGDRDKVIPTAPWGTVFNDPGTRIRDAYTLFQLRWNPALIQGWDTQALVAYNRYDYDGDYLYDYSETDEPDLTVWRDYARARSVTAEVRADGTPHPLAHVTAGLELGQALEETQASSDPYFDWSSEESPTDWAAFVQNESRFGERFILSLGLRYDHQPVTGGSANPRLAIIGMPREGTTLKALYGRAFRAPNGYELWYEDAGQSQKTPFSLEPETIEAWELILEQYVGYSTFFNATAFRFQLNELITLVTDPEDDLLVFTNLESAESEGLELEFRRDWTRGVSGRVSYAFQETKDRVTGERLSNAPRHLAKLNLGGPVPGAGAEVGLEVQYVGSRRTLAGSDVDAGTVTNLTVSRSIPGGIDLSVSAYNLFDREHYAPASEEHTQNAIIQPGRRLLVRMAYSF